MQPGQEVASLGAPVLITVLRKKLTSIGRERRLVGAEILAPESAALKKAHGRMGVARGVVLQAEGLSGERLRGVSCEAREGEIVGLAGLAGSGARELLLTVCGAVPFAAGLAAAPEVSPPDSSLVRA